MKVPRILPIGASLVLVVLALLSAGCSSNAASTSSAAPTPSPGTASNNTSTPSSGATTSSSLPPVNGLRTFQIVPAQTTASYSVYENLIFQNKPNNDAIGTTHSVQGSLRIQTSPSPLVQDVNIKIDLRTLQTDAPMRDNYVRRNSLQSDTYPYATFVSARTQALPTTYSDGQVIRFQLIGDLTMHGHTRSETFDVQGKVTGDTATGTATSSILMTDFGIQPPNLANIAVAQDKVTLTLTFTAKAA